MPDILALDFDGTIVRSWTAEPLEGARRAVAALDSDVRVAVITNQSGPCYRLRGSMKHPAPSEVAENLDRGLRAVGLSPARVERVFVATWPGEAWRGQPADGLRIAGVVAEQFRELLPALGWHQAYATESPGWRKPAPGMLVKLSSDLLVPAQDILYVGDRGEDAEAARAAGCRFRYAKEWWR